MGSLNYLRVIKKNAMWAEDQKRTSTPDKSLIKRKFYWFKWTEKKIHLCYI